MANCVLQLWLMAALRSIAVFASALSNAKMLIMLKMLRYLICLRFLLLCCFPLFVLTPKSFAVEAYASRKLPDYEHIHGGKSLFDNLKKVSGRRFFSFSPAT